MNLSNSASQLIALVERIERLDEELDALKDDRKEVFSESKTAGFDTATLRKCITLRRIPKEKRAEAEAILDTYMAALDKMEAQAVAQSKEDGA